MLPCGHLTALYICITMKFCVNMYTVSCVNTYTLSLLHSAKRMDSDLGISLVAPDVNRICAFYIHGSLVPCISNGAFQISEGLWLLSLVSKLHLTSVVNNSSSDSSGVKINEANYVQYLAVLQGRGVSEI